MPPQVEQGATVPPSAAAHHELDHCPIKTRSLRHEQPGRLVAIGDVHGDLAATRRALRMARAIDENDAWVGGNLTVVQTGDVLDRGDDEQEILDLLARLAKDAAKTGGAVYSLQGNHELMNAMGDFRYVTLGGYRDFFEGTLPEPLTAAGRVQAFFPGGTYAKKLSENDMVAIVGDSVFVHGGVLPRFASDLEKSNRAARCYLFGATKTPPPVIFDPEGPLWTRAFSTGDASCKRLTKTLDILGVSRMVVGHTPQLGGITSACEGRVWRIDTGMASYYHGPTEVFELEDGVVTVLR